MLQTVSVKPPSGVSVAPMMSATLLVMSGINSILFERLNLCGDDESRLFSDVGFQILGQAQSGIGEDANGGTHVHGAQS